MAGRCIPGTRNRLSLRDEIDRIGRRPSFGCGFASPPQLDLYVRTPFYHAGSFDAPPFTTLPNAPAAENRTPS